MTDRNGDTPSNEPGANLDAPNLDYGVLDHMCELVLVRCDAGRIRYVNQSFINAFGGKRQDWIGSWFAVAPEFDEDARSRRYDAAMRTKTGPVWLEWSETPLPDGGAISVGRDVSEEREKRVEQSQAAQGKSIFFAAITHELRTPLSGALGAASLLKDTPLKPDQQSYVDAVRSSAAHALSLIDDILDLTRLEAGHLQLRAEDTDLRALLQDVCEILAPRAGENGLHLMHAIDADVPALVKADPARVRQILFNLAGNAVKFTETGGVAIVIDRVGAHIRFSIRDTGPGIAKDHQSRLFEHFERGAAEDTKAPGAGLGLAMVRQLALAMDGDVGVQSEPGQGALFWATARLETVSEPPAARPLDKRALLVGTDLPIIGETLTRQAKALGAAAYHTGDRQALFDAARQANDQVTIILDENWVDIAPTLKDAFPKARILVLSQAHTKDRYVEDQRPDGIDGWLVAPVRLSSLGRYAAARAETDRGAAQTRPDDGQTLAGLRLLLAEDDPVNAMIAKTVLAKLGADVVHVDNGRDAFERAGSDDFDLALLDVRMPDMDGLEAARAIRALPHPYRALPLIALTANSTEADRSECLEAGMDAFLTKPLDAELLGERIIALCGPHFGASVGA